MFERLVKRRNDAIEKAVMQDDWLAVKDYCQEFNIKIPDDEKVFKAGIYKAASAIVGLPKEVKREAAIKCCMLGFDPWIGSAESSL